MPLEVQFKVTDSFCHAGEPAATPNVVVPITTDPQRLDAIQARVLHEAFTQQARRLREPIFRLTQPTHDEVPPSAQREVVLEGPNVLRFPQGPRAAEGVVDAE